MRHDFLCVSRQFNSVVVKCAQTQKHNSGERRKKREIKVQKIHKIKASRYLITVLGLWSYEFKDFLITNCFSLIIIRCSRLHFFLTQQFKTKVANSKLISVDWHRKLLHKSNFSQRHLEEFRIDTKNNTFIGFIDKLHRHHSSTHRRRQVSAKFLYD